MSDKTKDSVLQTGAVIIDNDGAMVVREPDFAVMYGVPTGIKPVLAMLVLDRSGSMNTYGNQPLIALNELIQNLRVAEGAERTWAGIITFAGDVREDAKPVPATELEDRTSYVANGSTALFKAVITALNKCFEFKKFAKNRDGLEAEVVVAVISDGGETDNYELQPEVIKLSEEARKQGFKLQVVGIGINAMQLSQQLGFTPGLAVTVEPTRQGVSRATRSVTQTFSQTMMGFGGRRERAASSPPPSRTGTGPISSSRP